MFMLGLGPIIIVHNRTGTSFSAREIASDHWYRPKIDRLLYCMAGSFRGVLIFIVFVVNLSVTKFPLTNFNDY